MHYDDLVVGAGLFGAVFAHEMQKRGRKVLVIEKKDHIAGNIYTEEVMGINVHRFGAHIFHTSDREVWEYVNQFAQFFSVGVQVSGNQNKRVHQIMLSPLVLPLVNGPLQC